MQKGNLVRVSAPRRQGAFKNRVGQIIDFTRSLKPPYPRVFFVFFEELGHRAWFEEDQLVEVKPCPSEEDDPAA